MEKLNLKQTYKKLMEGLAEGKKYEQIELFEDWDALNKGQKAAWFIYRNQMRWANDKNFAKYTNVENIEDVLIIDDIVWEKEYEGLIQTCKDNNITKIYFLDHSTAAQRVLCEFINAGGKITRTEMVHTGELFSFPETEKEYEPALIIEL